MAWRRIRSFTIPSLAHYHAPGRPLNCRVVLAGLQVGPPRFLDTRSPRILAWKERRTIMIHRRLSLGVAVPV